MCVRLDLECLGNNTSVQQKIISFRDPLEYKSKVSQKSCCNDLSQVATLKELVDGTLERDYTKATNVPVHKSL